MHEDSDGNWANLPNVVPKYIFQIFIKKQKENELSKSFSETRLDRQGFFKEQWSPKGTKSDTISHHQGQYFKRSIGQYFKRSITRNKKN